MKISNRLKSKFEDILAQFTKREISNFFEDNDIENVIEEALPDGGVRRALVKQYYKSIDWNNPTDVKNVLQVFADIIAAREKHNQDYGFGAIDNPYTEQIELLIINLRKDGWVYENGTITPIEVHTQQEQEVNLNVSNNPVVTTTEAATNATTNISADSEAPSVTKTSPPKVFVTYSWDGPEHEKKVVDFTNFLRKNGFNAELDKKLIQEQSAINFGKMMHQAFTDYDKVIIVLSIDYKKKADQFMGGVGNEYTIFINDINDSPKKYILVSFEGLSDNITPIGIKGREIVDLSKVEKQQDLFYKLLDQPVYEFAEVAPCLPVLETRKLAEFSPSTPPKEPFEIVKFLATSGNANISASKYDSVENECFIELRNTSGKTIDGFSVEIKFPCYLVENPYEFTHDGENCTIMTDSSSKVYPDQKRYTDKFIIKVTSRNYHKALNSVIKASIYSEIGTSTKEFNLKDVFITGKPHGEIEYLADAEFN
ncbi:SEFIR domain-containing protein [Botryobacter ruber]|uniref:SEFIR domain-containing protein n=1 Tax=Botryobacter ruber TaxID=2171629 RepID=UPI000E0C54A2|nr:SEFIR domain-containing protein [Botryobacter ruber]